MFMIFKDIYNYYFNKKLKDFKWLNHQIYHLQKSNETIAKEAGCSTQCFNWKQKQLQKKGLIGRDELRGVSTSKFHTICKKVAILIIRPFIPQIKKNVDELYPKIKSRNGLIFKKIIEEMDDKDRDVGSSMARSLHLTRKQFYLLAARFVIVLYEFDSYYAERIDFIIDQITKQHDKFYIDELADPQYWAPHRPQFLMAKYFAMRNTQTNVGVNVFFISKDDEGKQTIEQINYKKKEG